MSSAEPAVSTAGGNESDTSEQGRSEASSSSQDTSPTNESDTTEQGRSEASSSSKDASPTNDTSPEEKGAPVKDKKHKHIKWTNTTDPEQRFKSRYPKECNELKDLIAKRWPENFGYHPEVILKKKVKKDKHKSLYHLDVVDSKDHDTLMPNGALPWRSEMQEAITKLVDELKYMDNNGDSVAVDRTDADAVFNEVNPLRRRLEKFPSRPYDYKMSYPKAKIPTYAVSVVPRDRSKGVERIIGEFDTKAEMAVVLERQTRKAVLNLESQESQPKRQWIRKSIR